MTTIYTMCFSVVSSLTFRLYSVMFLTPAWWNSLYLFSMISTMLFKALAASEVSLITGPIRCGIFSYGVNSTFLGSISNSLTSSGVVLNNRVVMMELMHTDFPEPVEPAISICGSLLISAYTLSPERSLPKATVSGLRLYFSGTLYSSSLILTLVLSAFGISIPTTLWPGTGASIRTSLTARAILMFSCSEVIRLILIPGSGLTKNLVTDGPILASVRVHGTSNWSSISISSLPFSLALLRLAVLLTVVAFSSSDSLGFVYLRPVRE